jgi:hypothetical protein
VVDNTLNYALQIIEQNGGAVTAETATIMVETPAAPLLEVSFPNSVPIYRSSAFDDHGWEWSGQWQEIRGNPWGTESIVPRSRFADEPGAKVQFTFRGTGIALLGKWAQDGGKADIYLDDQLHRTIDAYYWWAGEGKDHMFLWHALNLEPGEHIVRLVVRGEKKSAATGTRIYLTNATVYTSIDKSNR